MNYRAPFIDNLFNACELLAKARLITIIRMRDVGSHGVIHSTINSWRKLGNVSDEFVDLFNKLSQARVLGSLRAISSKNHPLKSFAKK